LGDIKTRSTIGRALLDVLAELLLDEALLVDTVTVLVHAVDGVHEYVDGNGVESTVCEIDMARLLPVQEL
jgi:hypothetical protein